MSLLHFFVRSSSFALILAACPFFAQADAVADKKLVELQQTVEDQGIYLESATPGISLSGCIDAGYVFTSVNSAASTHVNNTGAGDFSVFQGGILIQKELDEKADYAAGFTIDLQYGEDLDVGSSGLVLDQVFATFRVPVGNGLDFSVGKFDGLIGYEWHRRFENANITPSLQAELFEPGTHVGAFACYAFSDSLDIVLGIGNGWEGDNGQFIGLGSNKESVDPYVITGAVTLFSPERNAKTIFAFAYSWDGEPELSQEYQLAGNVFIAEWCGKWRPKFAKDRWLLGYNVEGGFANGGRPFEGNSEGSDKFYSSGVSGAARSTTFYGVSLYSSYDICDKLTLSGRGEYVHSDDGAVPNGPLVDNLTADKYQNYAGSYDLWNYTLTANLHLWDNLITKVEYRIDWGNEVAWGEAGDGADGPIHTAAFETAYEF